MTSEEVLTQEQNVDAIKNSIVTYMIENGMATEESVGMPNVGNSFMVEVARSGLLYLFESTQIKQITSTEIKS